MPEFADAWRFRALLDSLDDLVYTLDGDGRYTWIFGGALRRFGLTAEHFLGKTTADMYGAEVAAAHDDARRRALAGERVTYLWNAGGGGEPFTWQITVAPLRDPAGEIVGVMGIGRDVTPLLAAREAAERERARLDAVLDALPVGIAIADANGGLVRTNAALAQIWGELPAAADIEGYAEYRAWSVDSGARVEPHEWALARALERGDVSRNELLEIERFDGRRAFVMNNAAPVRDADGTIDGAVAVVADVTEQRHAEEWHHLLATALDQTGSLVSIADTKLELIYVNRSAREANGYASFEEAREATRRQLQSPEAAAAIVNEIMPAVERDGEWSGHVRAKRPGEATTRTLATQISAIRGGDGRLRAYLSIAHDITDLKATERKLRESEERFRILFENLPVGAALVDPEHGRFVDANEAAAANLGYTREEFLALDLAELVEGGRQEEAEPSGVAPVRIPTRQWAKDGSIRDILVSMQRIMLGGRPMLYTVATDMTELNAATRALQQLTVELEARVEDRTLALRAANDALQAANQHKSAFLANMSHELRTPLNAILGFCELLHDGIVGPVNAVQQECLQDALTSARHLLHIIDDVLDLAKIESGQIDLQVAEVEPALVADEAISSLRHEAGRRSLTLELHDDGAPGVVATDGRRLKQILYNYLSNALKHSPDGGVVQVTLRRSAGGRPAGRGARRRRGDRGRGHGAPLHAVPAAGRRSGAAVCGDGAGAGVYQAARRGARRERRGGEQGGEREHVLGGAGRPPFPHSKRRSSPGGTILKGTSRTRHDGVMGRSPD